MTAIQAQVHWRIKITCSQRASTEQAQDRGGAQILVKFAGACRGNRVLEEVLLFIGIDKNCFIIQVRSLARILFKSMDVVL